MAEIKKLMKEDLREFAVFVKELKKDADAELFSIDKVADPESWGRNGILLNESGRGAFLIAKEGEKAIGFCNLFKKDDKYECGIGLLAEHRKKGIGSELTKTMIQEAKTIGIKELYAGIKKANKASVEFFKISGFKIAEEKENSLLFRKIIECVSD